MHLFGSSVGKAVGACVGTCVGVRVGSQDGMPVGTRVGAKERRSLVEATPRLVWVKAGVCWVCFAGACACEL
jgi:hypothetical protein